MKKYFKLFVALVFCLAMVCMVSFSAMASSVIYNGNADDFIFESNGKYSPTDLFENFSGCMPGDVLENEIIVKNDVYDSSCADIYLRSIGADDESEDLLSQLHLTVVNKNNGVVLFDSSASEKAQLSDWCCIGKFVPGEEVVLKVKLEIPITLDNRYQNVSFEIKKLTWQFKADESPYIPEPETTTVAQPTTAEPTQLPTEPEQPPQTEKPLPAPTTKPESVYTGDTPVSSVAVLLLAVSAAVVVATKKRK